jgi:hypothetical protein
MTTEQPNEIPNAYGVTIIFRHFKRMWIHERHFSIGSQNEFRTTVSSGIAWMQFGIGHKDLLCYREVYCSFVGAFVLIAIVVRSIRRRAQSGGDTKE